MIYLDILTCVEKALGTALDSDQRRRAVEVMAADMGGEAYYFQSLPKLKSRAALELIAGQLANASSTEIAKRTGLHVRTVQRLRKR